MIRIMVGRVAVNVWLVPGDPRGGRGGASGGAGLEVSGVEVALRPPWRPGRGLGEGQWERVWAVRVWEEAAEEGKPALEWILLSSRPVRGFGEARGAAGR